MRFRNPTKEEATLFKIFDMLALDYDIETNNLGMLIYKKKSNNLIMFVYFRFNRTCYTFFDPMTEKARSFFPVEPEIIEKAFIRWFRIKHNTRVKKIETLDLDEIIGSLAKYLFE